MHGGKYIFDDIHVIDDVVAVYRVLRDQNIAPSKLLAMTESAGGRLSLLTIQVLLTRQLSVPRDVIAIAS